VIILHGEKQDGTEFLMIVMEPANFEKIKLGMPLVLEGKKYGLPLEVCVAYTADSPWVAGQVRAGRDVLEAIQESVYREPVYDREHCEEVRLDT